MSLSRIFCEDIHWLSIIGNVHKKCLKLISNKMIADFNMLNLLVKDPIRLNTESSLIITKARCQMMLRNSEMVIEISQPLQFTTCVAMEQYLASMEKHEIVCCFFFFLISKG